MRFELTIIDEWDTSHLVEYVRNEYPSLMELLRDKLYSDIGDCRGRAWCSTCVVQAQERITSTESVSPDEHKLLSQIHLENVRLSCQLGLSNSLHQTTWKIVDSRNLI